MDIFKGKIYIFLLVAAALFFAGQSLLAEEIKVTTLAPGNQWVKSQETGHENDIYASNTVDPTYGNVGIGTSTPASLLDVNSKLNVLSGGNVGIGTTGPVAKLHVKGHIYSENNLYAYTGATLIGRIYQDSGIYKMESDGNRDIYIGSGSFPTALVMKGTTGNVGIGTVTPGAKLAISGLVGSSGGPTLKGLLYDTITGNVYYSSSSLRYKDSIQPFKDNFYKILNVSPKSFVDKTSKERNIGYIAEEFYASDLRRLVNYDKDGKPEGINYEMISLYLVEIVKDQQAALEELSKTVEMQQQEMQQLNKKIKSK